MKKLFTLFSLVAITANFLNAQNVHIPDANFKNALLNHVPIIDTDNNLEISIAEALVVSHLNLDNQNIADMTGIEAFVNLALLECSGNNFTTINLSQNTELGILWMNDVPLTQLNLQANNKLTSLQLSGLQLTNIDFSHNPLLHALDISGSSIGMLDFSNNPLLTTLYCSSNNLVYLNLKNENNSNFLQIAANGNPNLSCIEVDNPAFSYANWTVSDFLFDEGVVFAEDCSNLTYVPDDQFEAYLEANGMGDGFPNNDYVLTPNIYDVTSLAIDNLGIEDLTGIEDFASLTFLDCSLNSLTNLDLNQNTNLEELIAYQNSLVQLDMSQNLALQRLIIDNNQISDLNLSTNSYMKFLNVSYNALTTLDLTQTTYALEGLYVNNNRLEGVLDISHCPNLQDFDASNQHPDCPTCFAPAEFVVVNLQNGNNAAFTYINLGEIQTLKCVQVEDPVWSEANWTGSNFIFGSEVLFRDNCNEFLSITEVNSKEFSIYPNPVTDILHFSEEVSQIRIFDMSGKLVKQVAESSKFLDVNQLTKGMYILTADIRTGETLTKKLVKK